MKHSVSCLLFFVSCFIPELTLQAQWGRGFDSVALLKPKISRTVYNFTDGNRREIRLTGVKSELVELERNTAGNIGGGLMTAVTGIGWNSTSAATWKVSSGLACNDSLAEWTISLFCEGRLDKTRERVRESDGSWSVETSEYPVYYWDRKAVGIILEGSDTVGFFNICMDPVNDAVMREKAELILQSGQKEDAGNLRSWYVTGSPMTGHDYGITGVLSGKSFWMIHKGADRMVWISIDDKLSGKFQSDLLFSSVKKKYRTQPYLLVNNSISRDLRRELFRLAVLSVILSRYLSPV